jgi:hypothetical protein
MELHSGETCYIVTQFWHGKIAIRIKEECGNRVSCRNLFRKLQILPSISQYLLTSLMFVVSVQNLSSTHIENHNIDTS